METKKPVEYYHIDFEPIGRRGEFSSERSLLECAHQLGLGIKSICGGIGKCHACKVKILGGTVSEPTSNELDFFSTQEQTQGWRLACQTYPLSDCRLHVPAESITTPQRTQVEGIEIPLLPDPLVHSYSIDLSPPSFSDLRGDVDRLLERLQLQHQVQCDRVDIDVMRNLSPQLRSWDWRSSLTVRENEVIAIAPWATPSLGLAIDLGTTKIAGYLIDLKSGKTLAAKGVMNPQINYGEDIISRITHVINSPHKGKELKETVVEGLNLLIKDLCMEVGVKEEEIVDGVIVGNTAMHHLLLQLPVKQLAYAPFVPTVSQSLDVKSREVGLRMAPGSYIHFLPNIAGFVGADHTAVLIATEASQAKATLLVIDIGTNTEVSLIVDGEIVSASCASGPAFEGGHIKDGMRAASGAIEGLRIVNHQVQYQTIDGAPPVGICGSGILDALSQMYLTGILDKGGKMLENHPRVRSNSKQREFVLVSEEERGGNPAIVITQKDVRELQLAKAAIRTGIQLLLEHKAYPEEKIEQVIIAGAFGSYIDITSAIIIGMLPPLPVERFIQVGNAAGTGAKLALISSTKRREAQEIASKTHYLELTTVPNFMQTFMQTSHLGLYRMVNGERKEINEWKPK